MREKREDFLYTADYATTKDTISDYNAYLALRDRGNMDDQNKSKKIPHLGKRGGHNSIAIGARSVPTASTVRLWEL